MNIFALNQPNSTDDSLCLGGSLSRPTQWTALLAALITMLSFLQTSAQTALNVTNFGASGNAVSFLASTVSNSPVVTVAGTNIFSLADVGKVIEVFRAGPWVYYNGAPVVTNQDIICLITNIVNQTNLYLSIPAGWTRNSVYCIVGLNNAPAFQAAINSAEATIASQSETNVTIQVPPGAYLLISSNALNPNYVMSSISDTQPAVTVSSGGITICGASPTNTILMACGAGMEHLVNSSLAWISPTYAPYVPMRETMFFCSGPIAFSQYPFVLQNLTIDGGLTNGLQIYNYWMPIQGDGDGWDTTHHALADSDPDPTHPQMHQMKLFTNCVFQHWRGEMLICWTGAGGTNTFNDVANCTFRDGNASAINLYYGQHIHGCIFNSLVKVEEYYQANATLPTIFENNYWTNIASNPFSIVGSTTNASPPSITFSNNTMCGVANVGQISFSPAENVFVINNAFHGPSTGINFSAAGLQPNDGSASVISNIVIVGNAFNDTFLPICTDGYPATDVFVTNNTSLMPSQTLAILGGGWKYNFIFQANAAAVPVNASGVAAGGWPYDNPNNQFGPVTINDWTGGSNLVSYSHGGRYLVQHVMTNTIFYLDDSMPSLMPTNAILYVTNEWSQNAHICLSCVASATQTQVAPNSLVNFQWVNGAWQLLSQVAPPTGLHVVSP
jgi:hypothetical protein